MKVFENPLLLYAKMFLAEIRSWRKSYIAPNWVCTHFAKEIFDAATSRGIRCGYTIITFTNQQSHALITFDTDYGLIYFEPQSGEQTEVAVGKPYRGVEDILTETFIAAIQTVWNDEDEVKFLRCPNCEYLTPIFCPNCGEHKIVIE